MRQWAEAAQQAVPPLEGELRLAGLTAPVAVLRDGFGVPHIRAANMADAFFAQGFTHAQDRLFQMELNRRRALGRSAEWLGPVAFAADALARRLGMAAACRRDTEALGGEARAMLAAYVAGVNAFLASGAPLPVEYALLGATPEPWEDWHCLAVMRRLGLLMGSVWFKLWRAAALPIAGEAVTLLRYDDGGGDLLITPAGVEAERWRASLAELAPAAAALLEAAAPDATGGGSNNWVVAGHLSSTGRPVLAGDPHRVFEVPGMYAQGQLACPEIDAIGLAVPGVPGFPHFAQNGRVAWCVTHTFADIHDLYLERFDAEARHALFQGAWEPVWRREEMVAVRGDAPRPVEILETRHGPVICGDPAKGTALALKSVQFAETDLSFDCLPRMLRAGSVAQLYEATRGWGLIDHNLLAADTGGHTGWLLRARLPRRGRENGWLPVPGWTGAHEWQGWIAHEDMPRLIDPAPGLLATANNRPVADDHPDYICTDCHPPYRAKRILALLAAPALRSPEGAARIHADTLSQPAAELRDRLRTLAGLSPAAEALRARLLAWNARMEAGSAEATAYIALRLALVRRFGATSGLAALAGTEWLSPAPGVAPLTQLWWATPALLRADDAGLLRGATWNTLLAEALEEVAAAPPTTPWGEMHQPRFTHPLSALFPEAAPVLDPPSLPIGGDGDTVLANGVVAPAGPSAAYGALARYVFDVGAFQNSRWCVFLGASGHPGSPHYADQNPIWSRCEMVPMQAEWPALEALARRQTLLPG
ncbi:penicillin acylase family protein [Siccirubricoccus sp. KC 17139]|uniref:Penicillin acylase family protein n=1 Tax=Siccirubricoccus soli TaxID=2899147 RepID=A0ABT1D4I8_9PROT|nr:penicillin acylase family protein [Siccirubricoccus soli]MCO6416842.1 penicillin acylase family protein [Siccirubricoccus soli]MCP2682977.1 penicillin acylase family protein [Siccirubricoccus soli]